MQSAQELTKVVGANLRRLRAAQRLSLSWVAKTSGVGKATLSDLEGGRGNPTMRTLLDLAHTLGAAPSDLMSPADDTGMHVTRRAQATPIAGPVFETRFINAIQAGTTRLELFHIEVPLTQQPQQSQGHLGREHLFVAQGNLEIGPPDEIATLAAGDYICFDGTKPHSYWAKTDVVHGLLLLEHQPTRHPPPQKRD